MVGAEWWVLGAECWVGGWWSTDEPDSSVFALWLITNVKWIELSVPFWPFLVTLGAILLHTATCIQPGCLRTKVFDTLLLAARNQADISSTSFRGEDTDLSEPTRRA